MWQVVVGGLIALASGWVLDGGIKRRARRTIREELELAGLLGETPEADRLRALAGRRLQRYSTSFWARFNAQSRMRKWLGWMTIAAATGGVIALGLSQDWGGSKSSDSPLSDPLGAAVLVGLIASTTYLILEHGLVGLMDRMAQTTEKVLDPVFSRLTKVLRPGHKFSNRVVDRLVYGADREARREAGESWVSPPPYPPRRRQDFEED